MSPTLNEIFDKNAAAKENASNSAAVPAAHGQHWLEHSPLVRQRYNAAPVLEDSNNESSVSLAKINYSKIANSALGKTAVTSWIIRQLASNFHH